MWLGHALRDVDLENLGQLAEELDDFLELGQRQIVMLIFFQHQREVLIKSVITCLML